MQQPTTNTEDNLVSPFPRRDSTESIKSNRVSAARRGNVWAAVGRDAEAVPPVLGHTTTTATIRRQAAQPGSARPLCLTTG